MAIYVAFSEKDGRLSNLDQWDVNSQAGRIQSHVRSGLLFNNNTGSTSSLFFPTNLQTGWFTLYISGPSSTGSASTTTTPLQFFDQADNFIFGLRKGTLSLVYFLDATWIGDPINLASGNFKLDFNWSIGNPGFLRVFTGNTLAYEFEGDTTNSVSTHVSKCVFGRNITTFQSNTNWVISEVVLSDESTIGSRLISIPFGVTGSTMGWSGDLDDIISDVLDDDASVFTSTDGARWTLEHAAMPELAEDEAVRAVIVSSRALANEASNVPNIAPVARISDTDYVGAPVALTDAFQGEIPLFAINPATSLKWTEAAINAAEFGLEAQEDPA